eukprot:gnl/MRDRNA2_/MRDRNA2_86054_c0_seq1.p1 gnl/MRDRNA2_/MRDRNA2_86054_c0~~gnl/MRDRNA2_/MRDRNA2_86054_c0_seq1.p1  ORF type:complete len:116 (-),score=8.82 gnl/MRDRNA2_/MRDRNA2_86054_c0_seq1:70-417(-)
MPQLGKDSAVSTLTFFVAVFNLQQVCWGGVLLLGILMPPPTPPRPSCGPKNAAAWERQSVLPSFLFVCLPSLAASAASLDPCPNPKLGSAHQPLTTYVRCASSENKFLFLLSPAT